MVYRVPFLFCDLKRIEKDLSNIFRSLTEQTEIGQCFWSEGSVPTSRKLYKVRSQTAWASAFLHLEYSEKAAAVFKGSEIKNMCYMNQECMLYPVVINKTMKIKFALT